jgi:hypothetical protein
MRLFPVVELGRAVYRVWRIVCYLVGDSANMIDWATGSLRGVEGIEMRTEVRYLEYGVVEGFVLPWDGALTQSVGHRKVEMGLTFVEQKMRIGCLMATNHSSGPGIAVWRNWSGADTMRGRGGNISRTAMHAMFSLGILDASWFEIIGCRIHRSKTHVAGLGLDTDRGEQDRPPPEFMHARSGANSRWLQTISLFRESVGIRRSLSSPITPMLQARILQRCLHPTSSPLAPANC